MTYNKYLSFAIVAFVAISLAFSAVMMISAPAHAADGALTADDYFGDSSTGSAFASESGLGQADLTDTIAQIIRVALGFLGIIAVVIILMGGFKWMTAQGNDDKVTEAKKLIISGIIGLVIILSAYAIASFVISNLVTATAGIPPAE
jgi:hypothetical protein